MKLLQLLLLGLGVFLLTQCATVHVAERAESSVWENRSGVYAGFQKTKTHYRTADGRERERSVYLWYPTQETPSKLRRGIQVGVVAENAPILAGRHPLIIFSHGYLGSGEQALFLMESLAQAGYVVASLDHADSPKGSKKGVRAAPPRFVEPRSWTAAKFWDRREDMVALLDQLQRWNRDKASFLAGSMDMQAIGMAGHSLGGYTTMGMVGARDTWREDRIKAALIFSPYAMPFASPESLKAVNVPVMLQGGTLDKPLTPALPGLYEQLNGTKYLLVLRGASHFAWTNLSTMGGTSAAGLRKQGLARQISEYSVAFFDETLKGKRPAILREQNDKVHLFKWDDAP